MHHSLLDLTLILEEEGAWTLSSNRLSSPSVWSPPYGDKNECGHMFLFFHKEMSLLFQEGKTWILFENCKLARWGGSCF